MKRQIVEELTQRKLMMINALYSNTNYDGKEGSDARQNAIDELENQFQNAVWQLYEGRDAPAENAVEIDKSNPFFSKIDEGLPQLKESPTQEDKSTNGWFNVESDVE